MELRQGYKQTNVGVIPWDWVVRELADLKPFVTSGSRGWARFYAERGDLFVRITNLTRKSIYLDLEDCKYVKLPKGYSEGVRTQLKEGDVLISITADIGIIGYIDASVPAPAYINQHIALVRFEPSKANSKFVSYFLASEGPQKVFHASTDTGAKAGMSLSGVQKIQTALPPTIAEQIGIATALSDADALLSGLDKLIAKKRDLKQATMQQLLTGKTRLPGFGGDWEVRRLGDVASMGSGGTPSSAISSYYGGEIPWVSIADMTAAGKIIEETQKMLTPLGLERSTAQLFPAGTILYAMYASLGECSIAGIPACTSQAILGIQTSARLSNEFLYYYLTSIKSHIKTLGQQGTQPNLNKGMVQDFRVGLPSVEEQTAIAKVLSDMDAELAALDAQRDKTLLLKQGMMQELLTGRTRLI